MDNINVVYAANDNYAALAGVSMLSLFENNKKCKKLNVYILSDRIQNANLNKLQKIGRNYQRDVHIVDVSNALSAFGQKGGGQICE